MDASTPRRWHALSPSETLDALDVSPKRGLDSAEAQRRLQAHGRNALPEAKPRSAWQRWWSQFKNLLIQVLLIASVLTAALGHWIDTLVILLVVLLNASIGFFQEGKAERALAALRAMLSAEARVLRDGKLSTIPATELVPGDILTVEAGDRVPADLRWLEAHSLRAEEAALTGESVPVDKHTRALDEDTPLGDRRCLAFSGTLITQGRGKALVVATGVNTEIGRISGMLADVEELATPLTVAMAAFAKLLTWLILGGTALLVLLAVLVLGQTWSDVLMAAVALAVAAIPEGLPAILTVTLAIGVQGMAQKNAILRRLPAVETLGSVTLICSDKTGTLTRNEMTVRSLLTADHDLTLSGLGYSDGGEVLRDDHPFYVPAPSPAGRALRAMALCSDARIERKGPGWTLDGDPMEAALLFAARKADIDLDALVDEHPRRAELPFNADVRYMATLHSRPDADGYLLVVKGAPERLLELSATVATSEGDVPLDHARWEERVAALAGEGQRVLAVATRLLDEIPESLEPSHLQGLTLLAFFGLLDPPRPEAITAVEACQSAGISVRMITGDHARTAQAIAKQLGLLHTQRVMVGADIEKLDDDALEREIAEVSVFARAAPEHKLRLVQALQRRGHVVAMTGDGVNDAPALKQANIGIAMGCKGTEAAKEASEMVLADDNFATIANAVHAGRQVYDNLKKAITFLLPVNGGESAAIVVAILASWSLPMTPLQVLWVNMVSSVALAMSLAFEPAEPDIMRRPPRAQNEAMMSPTLVWRIFFISAVFCAGIFGAFFGSLHLGYSEDAARTMAVHTLVALEIAYLMSVRTSATLARPNVLFRLPRATLAAIGLVFLLQVAFSALPFLQATFQSTTLAWPQIGALGASALAGFLLMEGEKALTQGLRRAHARRR